MKLRLLFATLALAAAAVPTWAHHAFAAEYDAKKPVKLTGAVTKIDWTNPHVYFFVDVEDESGRVTNWAFEMAAPSALKGSGWTRTSMKIGDVIIVEGTRAKDGGNHGNARAVTMASSGKRLGAASSEGRN
jgi:Family of unknown function (DUF6152)